MERKMTKQTLDEWAADVFFLCEAARMKTGERVTTEEMESRYWKWVAQMTTESMLTDGLFERIGPDEYRRTNKQPTDNGNASFIRAVEQYARAAARPET
jgi:hypothetical protein